MTVSLLSKSKRTRMTAGLSLILVFFVVASILTGQNLKEKATSAWLGHADREAQRITNESLSWLSVFQSNLQSLATLFYASNQVTNDEFFDALALIEKSEVATPVASWGYTEVSPASHGKKTFQLPVIFSTDTTGALAVGNDLSGNPALEETALKAMYNPGQIVVGSPYTDQNNNRHLVFAITVPCRGCETGILFSSLNMDDFFKDLENLYIPKGLVLHLGELTEDFLEPNSGITIMGPLGSINESSRVLKLSTETGGENWRFTWLIEDSYLGGPALGLANIIQWGGSALALLLFALFFHLSHENIRINRLVERKTLELRKALQETEQANLKLEELSRIDSLTQIPNRRFLDEFVAREWGEAQRSATNIAVIIIDIDQFKAYNDSLGHILGDKCLQDIANILHKTIKRPSDFIARYGGEEFICILPGTDFNGTCTICERLHQAVLDAALPHPSSSVAEIITVSMGAASCVATVENDVGALIGEADRLLYQAKNAGRNQYLATYVDLAAPTVKKA